MSPGRLSSALEAEPDASWSLPEMEYCHRISAYLGLSLETIMSMARMVPTRSRAQRDRKRGMFETVRPRRGKLTGAPDFAASRLRLNRAGAQRGDELAPSPGG